MAETKLPQMADILMPLAPPAPASAWQIITLLIIGMVIGTAAWRFIRDPYRRLARKLRHGVLTPREAAHALARLPISNTALYEDLDRLRFKRRPPDKQAMLAFMRKASHGR